MDPQHWAAPTRAYLLHSPVMASVDWLAVFSCSDWCPHAVLPPAPAGWLPPPPLQLEFPPKIVSFANMIILSKKISKCSRIYVTS